MMRQEIRLAGSGGQGLILGARILFRALGLEGHRAAQSQSYEPTSRGGFCHSDVIVTEDASDYPLVTSIDVAILLDQVGADRSAAMLRPQAIVIADERAVASLGGTFREYRLPITARASALGSGRVANIVALAAAARITGLVSEEALARAVSLETPPKFAELNQRAVHEGFKLPATTHVAA